MNNWNKIKGFFQNVAEAFKNNELNKTRSLRSKITLMVTLTLLVPICLSGIYLYYFIYNNIFNQNLSRELNQSIQSINNSLLPKYRIIENTFNLFQSNQSIHHNLEQLAIQKQTYYFKAKTSLDMETQLKYSVVNDFAWNSKILKSVFIYKDPSNYYYLLQNYLPDDRVISDHIKYIKPNENRKIETREIALSYSYSSIYFMEDIENIITGQTIGKLVLSIDENSLFDAYSSIIRYPDWKTYIYDSNGMIFFNNDRNLIGKKIEPEIMNSATSDIIKLNISNTEYLVLSQKIPDMNMTTVIMAPRENMIIKLRQMVSSYFYLVNLIALIALIISAYVVTNVTRPLKDIITNIEEANTGNFNSKMPMYKYYELNQVSTTFNKMIDKIQYLFNEVYQKQLLLSEAELKALQAQINPHFLFNVLELISWEARMSKNDKIYKMVNSLGQLIRANISLSSREKIKIKEELEYIEFYLYLQKMRFGDKIDVDIAVADDAILELYLPKLSLQPVVENAVIHGLEPKRGKGSLKINILMLQNQLLFEVIDNGVGFDVSGIDLNTDEKIEYSDNHRSHIGLINVNKRIKLIYGNEYGLSIESIINHGTWVCIKIPFDRGV